MNLSKGDIGSDNAKFLGAILVNQLLIAALSRRDKPEQQRRPFHLYVDEYQNFATKSFPDLQSEARKYAIDTIVAHQYRDQLDDLNQGSSLNVANLVVLRVSGRDAGEVASQYDLTPPPAQAKYEPIRIEVGEGIFTHDKTPSGMPLEQVVEGDQIPYSDMLLEMANELAQQGNYEAVCRVLEPASPPLRLQQFSIYLRDKPAINGEEAQAASTNIRQNAQKQAKYTREEIAAYVADQTLCGGDESGLIPALDIQ